jgi:uncharacterized protein YciI
MSELKHYLYRIQPVRPAMLTEGPTPEEAQWVNEHFAYLKGLTEKGIVLLAGRTTNTDHSSFGIVIFLAESDEAMHDLVANDPAVKNRVMRAEIYPYRIALISKSILES